MLDSLIFSVNTVAPIFIMVLLGAILKKTGLFTSGFFACADKLVFQIALPSMLFLELVNGERDTLFDPAFIGFCVLGILLLFLLLCVLVPIFVRDNAKRGAFIQGVYRSNFAILGVPLVENMCGEAGRAQIAMVMPFAIVLFNILAVIILSVCSPEQKGAGWKTAAKNILLQVIKNPLIIAVLFSLPFLIFPIPLPVIASKSLGYLSGLAFPVALMSLGGNFTISSLKGRLGLAITASVLKTALVPLIMVSAALLLGFQGAQIAVVFVLFGGPAAASSYIMAKNMDSDYRLAGQIMLLSTLICTATMFIGVFILKFHHII